jgi:uncharacterized protein YcbK (DUF882 family)
MQGLGGTKSGLNRRALIRGGCASLAGLALMPWWRQPLAAAPRSLSFYHTHTGERLTLDYHDGVAHVPEALAAAAEFLRDFRTGEVCAMGPSLFDFLHAVQRATESCGTFEVISGYRSPRTNEALRRQGRGVAKRSLHMQGKAIDVRLTDVDSAVLRDAAIRLALGGVGYYARPDFVHLDLGRVRRW